MCYLQAMLRANIFTALEETVAPQVRFLIISFLLLHFLFLKKE